MTETARPEADGNPFSPRAVLALVVLGAAVFIVLLWMIGAGMASGSTNDGGAHAGGKGLNGYAALAGLLERRGFAVRRSRSEAALTDPGLLILTPPASAEGPDIDRIVAQRHVIGPTIVVTPKWLAVPVPTGTAKAKPGWVVLAGTAPPNWPGFRDDVSLTLKPASSARWGAIGLTGKLPAPQAVQSGAGRLLVPLVVTEDGRMLAAYIDDGGYYPALEDIALRPPESDADRDGVYPLVLVFEPDLLDNYGFADPATARLAELVIHAAADGSEDMPISFDLTLNGHARSVNLLTLAFTPPFLAATLCLLLAALVAGWRAFLRFGPPRKAARAIAFGKRALVANAAGLLRRTRRLHLIAPTYAAAARERLAKALALPRGLDQEATDAAIDRALEARHAAAPFSATAARLRAARRPHDILRAARDLHILERTLTR